jgi:hypothetical protein
MAAEGTGDLDRGELVRVAPGASVKSVAVDSDGSRHGQARCLTDMVFLESQRHKLQKRFVSLLKNA